jgi:hypothetical protein
MKKLAMVLLVALSSAALAQDSSAQATPGTGKFSRQSSADEINYSDTYCTGFVSSQKYSRANHVTGGLQSPHATRFAERENVYLAGGGYTVGSVYSVLREVQDANKYEIFPGQQNLIKKFGGMYADIAHVRVTYIEGKSAVAVVEFACESVVPGDFLVPFAERAAVNLKPRTAPFQIYKPMEGSDTGRILMGRDFDQFLGVGQKIYVSMGSNKGVKPGDYLRITRNYDPDRLAPIDKISVAATTLEDTQKDPAKMSKSSDKDMPYHGIGELIVLNVTDTTATGMITLALEDAQPGDIVEHTSR